MPSSLSEGCFPSWKIENLTVQNGSLGSSDMRSLAELAADIDHLYLYPYLEPGLRVAYQKEVRHTVAHYLRAFRFHTDRFSIEEASQLRIRLAYLYWVSLHTGPDNPQMTKVFLNMYHEFGKYKNSV